MPADFHILSAVSRLRAAIKACFTAQGEVPADIPLATTSIQVAQADGDFPQTILQVKSAKAAFGDNCAVLSVRLTLPVVVHHIRAPEPGTGVAAETALTRLSALAAYLTANFQLENLRDPSDPLLIESVTVDSLDAGDDNPVQMMLENNSQNESQVAVSLSLTVTWVEATHDET